MSSSVQPHRRQPTSLPRPWDSQGKNTGVGCHFLLQCMKVKSESEVTQSCSILSDPMDYSPPGSSVHGIFQAGVLEWGAIAFSVGHNDRCSKSSCQQRPLPLKTLDKHSSLLLPGGSWHLGHSSPCAASLQPQSIFTCPLPLCLCVSVLFSLPIKTPVIGLRAYLIQHDFMLADSFGNKIILWFSG